MDVAVPGAVDGGEVAAAGPHAGPTPRGSAVVATVSVVIILACVGVLGTLLARADGGPLDRVASLVGVSPGTDEDADDPALRETVMRQADQFVLRINTYGPEDLAEDGTLTAYADRVREVITPKFAVDFENQGLPLAEQSVSQAGAGRTAEIFATGTVAVADDTATVLVAGALTASVPDSREEGRVEFDPTPFRWQVTLVRVEGSWLVDGFAPVTGVPEEQGNPTSPQATPEATPQATPQGTPTPRPTQQPSQPATPQPTQQPTGGAR